MPFQTWLLDLKFENHRVTGWPVLEIELLWVVSFFRPGSGQYMPNTWKYHNHLSSQISTGWMHLEINAALHCLSSFPWRLFHTAVSWSFLCLSSLRFSPHDPILTGHHAFAPSGPILLSYKLRIVRVEFCGKASARAWQETHDLRNAMKHTAHIILQTCKKSHHSFSHLICWKIEVSCRNTHSALAAWLKKWPHYKQLLPGTFFEGFLVILNMPGRTNIVQPPTNSWPVHPHLSCLIPLLPYTNFTSWESHPFRHFRLYNIHFTGMTCLDPRLEIRKLQDVFKLNLSVKVFRLMIWGSMMARVPTSGLSFRHWI